MGVRIRKAEPGDVQDIGDLLRHFTGQRLDDTSVNDRLRMIERSAIDELFVLENEDGIQALLGFRIRENIEEVSRFGEVSILVTRPEARRAGHARALMAFAEQLAQNRGCKGTWLVSGFGREAEAHEFYKRLGYEATGYRFVKPI
jgi:GNAT superfamily N-acetyltransferase